MCSEFSSAIHHRRPGGFVRHLRTCFPERTAVFTYAGGRRRTGCLRRLGADDVGTKGGTRVDAFANFQMRGPIDVARAITCSPISARGDVHEN
jgi:hypothetical protein